MRVKVLGSAAGGGFPQWNCACPNCSALRDGKLKARPRTQAQVAVSSDPSHWFLLNASPDLRQQILATPELSATSLGPPVSRILLTSADVDCVMGLLHLREFQPLHIYSTLSVRRIVTEENSLFRVLARSNPPVRWDSFPPNEAARPRGKWAIFRSLATAVFFDAPSGLENPAACSSI